MEWLLKNSLIFLVATIKEQTNKQTPETTTIFRMHGESSFWEDTYEPLSPGAGAMWRCSTEFMGKVSNMFMNFLLK